MTPKNIDFRSDTITKPTPAMRDAMASAVVGDDVLGDDPTVIALQEKVAKLLGKEAAVFVPSGTMANQIAVRSHTEHGDEVILESGGHCFLHETGALGALCGVSTQLLDGKRGILSAAQIEAAIRHENDHYPPTRLVILENTHNQGGGTVYPIEEIRKIREVAKRRNLSVHMDGARLWNACITSGLSPKEFASQVDSLSVCLSKGLGAPVGSLVAGSQKFIQRARRFRKMFGGAMRQSGILAAAGIYALENHFERIKEDHTNAKFFAQGLSQIPNMEINVREVETNLVYFGMKNKSPEWLEKKLAEHGILTFAERPTEVRAVFHLDVTRQDAEAALDIIRTKISLEK